MVFCRGVFVGIMFYAFCVGAVFGANGPATQTGQTTRTSSGNSVNSSTASYTSGANIGGGQSSASCSKSGAACNVTKNGKIVGTGTCNNKFVCVAKECKEPYYLEHYTVVSDKNNGFKCSISGQNVITGKSEYGDDVQVCGSKGICRTREQAKKANKCSVDAALLTVNSKTVIAGCQSIEKKSENCTSTQILKENKCVDCPGCKNVANGTCSQLDSLDNVCQYRTSCNDGYEHESGTENTDNPICNPKKFTIRLDSNGGSVCTGMIHTYGAQTAITCEPTKSGFIFDGWCTTNALTDPQKNRVIDATDMGEKTFYAKWTAIEIKNDNSDATVVPVEELNVTIPEEEEVPEDIIYRISYELDGGTGCETAYSFADKEIECVPTKDGFDFGGWCYDTNKTDCGGIDGKFTVKPDKNTNRITMYAKWTKKEQQSQVTQQRAECSEEEKAQFPHAIKFEFADGKCWVAACEMGYKLENGICVDDGIQEAEDAYNTAKEKEQSLENRMLSGLTMAATGIGGMELARGLAEQNADAAAEADMTAYIETFQCRIGDNGAKIDGGKSGMETPGANQLINLYQEYVDLAADLRERKQALGMRAGIESEVILDKASTGLYDDKGTGIENGTYASLYRASQGNEKDKERLTEQSDASGRRVSIGGAVAGAGVVGGVIGNVSINGGDGK